MRPAGQLESGWEAAGVGLAVCLGSPPGPHAVLFLSPSLPTSTACRESDLLAMLDHPHVVECKDVIRSPRQLVLVLEWLR